MSIPRPMHIWPKQDQIISGYHQISADELIKKTVENKQGIISDTGALVVKTGKFTGRSPKDRYLVKDKMTSWERVNEWQHARSKVLFSMMGYSLRNRHASRILASLTKGA